MNARALIAWLRQPTSVAALATIAGTVTAIAAHQVTPAEAAPILVGAVIGLILPDNTKAASDAKKFAADAVAAVETPDAAASTAVVLDAAAVAQDVAQAPAKKGS